MKLDKDGTRRYLQPEHVVEAQPSTHHATHMDFQFDVYGLETGVNVLLRHLTDDI